jgi:DNA-directed RNA polymerase beta' subunit
MTCKGILTSINRQGIKRGDVGPLAKSSFEDTTDQLIKAGIFAERDTLKGVSSNIMMGQKIKSGTGMCDIYLDEEEMFRNIDMIESNDNTIYENEDNIDTLLNIEEEGDCTNSDFKFSFE